ncbi:MAG: hypothetical protein ABIP49_03340 [Lysobacterales bacterium]
MSANPVFALHQWTHAQVTERIVELALADDTDSFEWHCLDREVQNRLANDYVDRNPNAPSPPPGRFRPVLIVNIE